MVFWFIVSIIVSSICGLCLIIGGADFWLWFFALGGEIFNLCLIRYFISDNYIDSEDSATKVMCIIGTVFWIIGLSIAFLISPDSKNVVLPWILLAGILVAPYLIVASLDAFFDDSLWAIILIGIAKLTSSIFLYMGTLQFLNDMQKKVPGKTIVSFVIIGVLAALIWIPIIFEKISLAVKGWLERKKRKEEQRKISYSNQLISAAGNNDKSKVLDMLDLGADVNYENSDGKTPLLNAAISGSLDVASILIDKGADVNCKDSSEQTPLLFAANANNKDMVSLLWKRGANINSRNSSGKTALDYAIENESEEIISFLLENGADIGNDDSNIKNLLDFAIKNGKDNLLLLLAEKAAKDDIYCEEKPILFFAIEKDCKKFVELLIKKDVHKKSRFDNEDLGNMTPLHFAAFLRKKDIVSLLLKNNADVDDGVKTKDNIRSPLFETVMNKDKEIATILLENGANINYHDKKGFTPLMLSCLIKDKDMATFLLEKGADINYVISTTFSDDIKSFLRKQGADTKLTNSLGSFTQTVLSDAIDSRNEEMVSFLIEKGANVNLEVSINNGNEEYFYTMLQKAIYTGNKKIISLLLDASADINDNSMNTETALMTAVDKENYNPEIVSLLIEKGADINKEGDNNRTPLTLAVSQNNKDAVLLLLKNGADPNKKGSKASSPLLVAFVTVNKDMVSLLMQNGADSSEIFCLAAAMPTTDAAQFLLDNGADVNCETSDGRTPLSSAICFSQKEMVLFLISNGADVNFEKSGDTSDKTGARTPLECAIVTGSAEMVSLLLTYGADVNYKCQNGNTPLLFAARHKRTELVPILKKAGATSFVPPQNTRPSSISTSSGSPSNSDLSENSADFNSALVALSKIIAKNGVEIFASENSKKLKAFISDLIPQENKIAAKLKQALSCDFAQIIFDANDKSDDKKVKAYNEAVDKIIGEANLEKRTAALIVKLLSLSLEWDFENLNLQ